MPYRTHDTIPVWGQLQDSALQQMNNCLKHDKAVLAALMADHHHGYVQPIGGVIAYHEAVSPAGVGYDIACGNKAVRLDISAIEVRNNISTIMSDITRNISFGVGSKNQQPVDHAIFNDPIWKLEPLIKWKHLAISQLGSVGSGNHYVDIFIDELNRVWVGVHFGSRGLGHRIATHFIKSGGGKPNDVSPVVLNVNTNIGEDYLKSMSLAGRYAYAGRNWVCRKIATILGASILEEVHNHHNFAWKELHNDMELWVVRKGATPAYPKQRSFVGGSMGDISVIIEGLDSNESKKAIYSTIHGAGRIMSRTEAAGKYRNGKRSGGKISRQMMLDWIERENVELRGANTDESPHCYRRLTQVLKHHAPTIRVLHKLQPIGVAMAH
ncbi:MAG: RNA-splicing ligase RtcB [Anaerolineaceae bacterium]|nr:RNA-splicing ligase RtcB [Anaerolineaceae bacterium]|tara:strand:+ start:22512 stop:23657 length:1146 start_codon:yes stop_codon:yes gene_type:complete